MVHLLEHFAGRDCMKITGLGESSLRTLYEEGYLTDLPSIFRLKDHRAQLWYQPATSILKVVEQRKADVTSL